MGVKRWSLECLDFLPSAKVKNNLIGDEKGVALAHVCYYSFIKHKINIDLISILNLLALVNFF